MTNSVFVLFMFHIYYKMHMLYIFYLYIYKSLILLSFLKHFAAGYRALGWPGIYFSILKIPGHCILPLIISIKKLDVSVTIIAPLKQCSFFLGYLKIFFSLYFALNYSLII